MAFFLLVSSTRYASTYFTYLDSLARFVFFSVSLSVTTEFVSLYDGESGRTLGVLLMMSFGRKNERFNVKFFSVSLSVTTEFVSLYDEESGRTLEVCLSYTSPSPRD